MKVESAAFTMSELRSFSDEYYEHERVVTAERIERASARLGELVDRIEAAAEPDGDAWTAREILAHLTASCRFFGVLAYKVSSGQVTEFDLLSGVRQRDNSIQSAAGHDPRALVRALQADLARSAAYLRSADAAALQRRVDLADGFTVTAEHIARMFLCAHLEQHLAQLKSLLS